jgi:protein gp37
VFCASLADIFEDRADLIPSRVRVFRTIDQCPWLDFLLLTKRPQNIRRLWPGLLGRSNVWLGTSVSDQQTAEELLPQLITCRDLAPVLFASAEPLLGPIDFRFSVFGVSAIETLEWIIFGGESGPHARPCNVNWIRDGLEQCEQVPVPAFVKQLGSQVCRYFLADPKGGDPSEWPHDLRVRQFP